MEIIPMVDLTISFRKRAVILFSILLVAFPLLAQGEVGGSDTQEVIAKGVGAIIGGDEAKARDDALDNALRAAVEQVVGTMVQSEVLVKNYMLVEDNIYRQSRGYVQKYEIISENRRGDNILEVTIRAVVKRGDLKGDLEAIGVLMARKGKPRLMVIVDEKNMGNPYWGWSVDMNTSENAIMSALMEKGFPFVDRAIAMRKVKKDAVMAALNGDETAARLIATQAGAEILIIGKAFSKAASGGPAVLRQSGMVSCQATINLRAVRADDGSILATSMKQAAAAHIDQLTGGTMALERAAKAAAEELGDKIVARWQKDLSAGTMVNLRLLNVGSYSDLVKFKSLLPVMIRNVKKVYQRDFSNNTAELELETTTTANKIAEEMALKDFSPFVVEVLNVTQNTITAKISRKEQ